MLTALKLFVLLCCFRMFNSLLLPISYSRLIINIATFRPTTEAACRRGCPFHERVPPACSDITSASGRVRPFFLFLCAFPAQASVPSLTSVTLLEERRVRGTTAMVSACAWSKRREAGGLFTLQPVGGLQRAPSRPPGLGLEFRRRGVPAAGPRV